MWSGGQLLAFVVGIVVTVVAGFIALIRSQTADARPDVPEVNGTWHFLDLLPASFVHCLMEPDENPMMLG